MGEISNKEKSGITLTFRNQKQNKSKSFTAVGIPFDELYDKVFYFVENLCKLRPGENMEIMVIKNEEY